MAQLNTIPVKRRTHEGGQAAPLTAKSELKKTVATCLLWEDTFYEKGNEIAERIAKLAEQVDIEYLCNLAVEARNRWKLRHVPLYLMCLAAAKRAACAKKQLYPRDGGLIEDAVVEIIQRPDELTELLAIYWREKRQPVAASIKRGLAKAFNKFGPYPLAKYNQLDKAVKLRDVLFLTHAEPINDAQAEDWKKLIDNELTPPDTWEVALSAGADKKETFERLLREGKLGGLATLRNLRNMQSVGVDTNLIRERLKAGCEKALPFRFVTAARYAPKLEPELEQAMYMAVKDIEKLPGSTGLLIDVSGSMEWAITPRKTVRAGTELPTRIDVAAGLAILLREKVEDVDIATFSTRTVTVPNRRGFALRDAIVNSQAHSSTYLKKSLEELKPRWSKLDRVIVITDEQSGDGCAAAYTKNAYIVNVAPYKYGVGTDGGWIRISGWSEGIFDYIQAIEEMK